MRLNPCKDPFTPKKSERESEKYQRTSKKDQRKKFKHEVKFSLSRSFLLGVNRPLEVTYFVEFLLLCNMYHLFCLSDTVDVLHDCDLILLLPTAREGNVSISVCQSF